MPNKKGGKKFKRGKKTYHETKLIYKDSNEDQDYGKVLRATGNGRFEIECFDGKNRLGIIAGKMRKKIWVNKGDIVLFSRWDFSTCDDKCSIIHKYSMDEVKKLQNENEFPAHVNLETENEFVDYGDIGDMISFEYTEPIDDNDDDAGDDTELDIDLDDI